MKLSYTRLAAAAVCLTTSPVLVQATDWTDKLSISGFSTAMYHATDEAQPFNGGPGVGHDDQGSYSGTKMGLNINAKINERLTFASQLFGAKEDNAYAVHVDWAFGALKLNDGLTLRTGKMKYPVGLVNEYVDVGYALPWISAPISLYSELGPAENGPGITRESYTGVSLLWAFDMADWEMEMDFFAGEVGLEDADVRQLGGAVLTANLDDEVLVKISYNSGTMREVVIEGANSGGDAWEQAKFNMMQAMEGAQHKVLSIGAKYDANDVLFMYEWADVTMDDIAAMQTTSWYTTVGYQVGKFLPNLTFENFTQGDGTGQFDDDQDIITLGVRWDYITNVSIKFELSQIKLNQGNGFFGYEGSPTDDTTNMFGTSLDLVF